MPPKRRTNDGSRRGRETLLDLCDHASGLASVLRERLFSRRSSHGSTVYGSTVSWIEAADDLGRMFGGDSASILAEPTLADVELRTRRLLAEIKAEDPFSNRWAADSVLARCCYLACRLAKPKVVVETGVAYGVSSAFVLAAMRENGFGELHSVDLTPLRRRARFFQGVAVSDDERRNWTLHRGSSRRTLPNLTRRLGGVDFFLHDSLHTRSNMAFEFDLALRNLRPGGVLLADDVERNRAFDDFVKNAGGYAAVVSDRESEPLHGDAAPTVFGIFAPGISAPKPPP